MAEDPKLDALLHRAAPPQAPSGLAESVLAAARARKLRRAWAVRAAGIAAAIVLAAGLCVLMHPADEAVSPPPPPQAAAPEAPVPEDEEESFAIELPSTGDATHQFMAGRCNGKMLVFVGPVRRGAASRTGGPSMMGFVGGENAGPSMAVQIR